MDNEKQNTPETSSDIQSQLATLAAALEEQKAISAKQQEIINALAQKPVAEEKPLPKVPKELVKSGNKNYKWAVPHFKFPGKDEVITAEDAATDKAMIEKILAIPGQGLLVQVF